MSVLKLGTRGSQLALFQANAVAGLLRAGAGVACEIVVIRTSGDRLADAPLAQIGGKRLFVKEIEDALVDGAVDLAVHSSKDMPAVLPDGLAIGAALPREDPRDAIVLPAPSAVEGPVPSAVEGPAPSTVEGPAAEGPVPSPVEGERSVDDVVKGLPASPRVGTSSVRRTAQLRRLLPGASFTAIRGNLDTRLRKLDSGAFDAIVLAAAGLRRLGQSTRISAALPSHVCVPAPGQGIIAVEVRSDDDRVKSAVESINDNQSAAMLAAERAVVVRLGGGCQMPIGAHATVSAGRLMLVAVVVSPDGRRMVRSEAAGALPDAEAIGAAAAARLLEQGAGEILAEVENARGAVEGLQP